MDVRYFEIEESRDSHLYIWYIPYENIPNYAFDDLKNILNRTKHFKLGDIKLKREKDFRLPTDCRVEFDENTTLSFVHHFCRPLVEEMLEDFVNLFNIRGKEPSDLDEEWKNGNIFFVSPQEYKYDCS